MKRQNRIYQASALALALVACPGADLGGPATGGPSDAALGGGDVDSVRADSGAAWAIARPVGAVGQRGDGGGSNAVDVAGDAGPLDAACDCSELAAPEVDADGEPLPRCDGDELLVADGYECAAGACSPRVTATACPAGCRSLSEVFGLPARCAN